MKRITIFAGTVEGRRLAETLAADDFDIDVCVATDYGAALLPSAENVYVHVGRMDREDMERFLSERASVCCVDATHPYAAEVTENIYHACKNTGIRYIRVLREETRISEKSDAVKIVYRNSVEEAAEYLAQTAGRIFITTGSKELEKYAVIPNYKERCTARVLPSLEVMEKCASLGFEGKNLICMQGPFGEDINYEMLRQCGAAWMVTKSSGAAGGFQDKCEAAIRAGVHILVIGRPTERKEQCVGYEEALRLIRGERNAAKGADCTEDNTAAVRNVYIIGMGPGNTGQLTGEAVRVLESCDAYVGAARMLEIWKDYKKKPYLVSYHTEKILSYIEEHAEYCNIAVLYSGDVGFYSGAAGLTFAIAKRGAADIRVHVIPGIASPVYFMDKLGIPWGDTVLVSNHGTSVSMLPLIRNNKRVCTLLGIGDTVGTVCGRLLEYGMDGIRVTVGERLSYDDEKITSGSPQDMLRREFSPLAVALFENPKPQDRLSVSGIPDGEFIRARVPMTKQEIRTLVLGRLKLHRASILYDIGAGTGSVSVEAALLAEEGRVYAVERNAEAAELIAQNRLKFGADNLEIVLGEAPEALVGLPQPSHAFIGGSGGNLLQIVEAVRRKNRYTRFVVTAVTMETTAELAELGKLYPEYKDMELVAVNVSRSRALGGYHLMSAENPVYIAAFGG